MVGHYIRGVARQGPRIMSIARSNDIIAIVATYETAAAFHIVIHCQESESPIYRADNLLKYVRELDPSTMCSLTITANDEHSFTLADRIESAGIPARGVESPSRQDNIEILP